MKYLKKYEKFIGTYKVTPNGTVIKIIGYDRFDDTIPYHVINVDGSTTWITPKVKKFRTATQEEIENFELQLKANQYNL